MRLLSLLVVLTSVSVSAQPLTLRYTLTSPLPPSDDNLFGGLTKLSDGNFDGIEDFAIRAYNPTSAYIYLSSGFTGEPFQTIQAVRQGGFGIATVEVGDATGDGVPDFHIGAPYEEVEFPSGWFETGAAYLYDGATGEPLWRAISPDPEEFGNFGQAAAPLGDADGDGRADVLVAEPGNNSVHAFSGATGDVLYSVPTLEGAFGATLVPLGDLDGDGVREVAASSDFGHAIVLSGASGAVYRVLTVPGAHLNHEMSAGDLDGDGQSELVIAAVTQTVDGVPNAGRVYVLSPVSGAVVRSFTAPAADVAADSVRYFGAAVAAGADLDGDAVADVAVTAWRSAPADRRVYLLSGATGAVLGWAESEAPGPYGYFGSQLALLGGGGGRLVVGASDETVNGVPRAGRVYVYGRGTVAGGREPPSPAVSLTVAPNPSAGNAALTLALPSAQAVRVAVVDALGRTVAVVHDGPLAAGRHRLALPAALAPGVYAVVGAGAAVRWVVAR